MSIIFYSVMITFLNLLGKFRLANKTSFLKILFIRERESTHMGAGGGAEGKGEEEVNSPLSRVPHLRFSPRILGSGPEPNADA